jgi:mannose-6-phosphate isomerase-like protein (cupin superfamily)
LRRRVVVGIAVAVAACHGEHTGTIAGPPLTVAPATSTSTSTSTSTPTSTSTSTPLPPPSAAFQKLASHGFDLHFAGCSELAVTPVTGTATVLEWQEQRNALKMSIESEVARLELAPGDVLVVRGVPEHHQKLSGEGLALVVTAQDPGCNTGTRVVRAAQAPELTFARGAMHAHLDIDDRDVASFYLGRLSGTAGVPEHSHDQSWEVLCAVEASGTFTLRGEASRLGPLTCVSVEPGAKHSWKPDPGSSLVGVQMYFPPGPEQRFKKLAADERARDR